MTFQKVLGVKMTRMAERTAFTLRQFGNGNFRFQAWSHGAQNGNFGKKGAGGE